jgi:hypothetical protein
MPVIIDQAGGQFNVDEAAGVNGRHNTVLLPQVLDDVLFGGG